MHINLQETMEGVEPIEDILRDIMKNGFERMCIVYDLITAMVLSFLTQLCTLYYKSIYVQYILFLCL